MTDTSFSQNGYLMRLKTRRQRSRAHGFWHPSASPSRAAHGSLGQDRSTLLRGPAAQSAASRGPAEPQARGSAVTLLPGSAAGYSSNYVAASPSEPCLRGTARGLQLGACPGSPGQAPAPALPAQMLLVPVEDPSVEGGSSSSSTVRERPALLRSCTLSSWKLRMGETGFLQDSPSAT